MHTPDMLTDSGFLHRNPWGLRIDGGLLPKQEHQHEPIVSHQDGWTAMAFWDRTVDTRPGSNSCFLAEGDYSLDEMCALAVKHFPRVVKRFPFLLAKVRRPE